MPVPNWRKVAVHEYVVWLVDFGYSFDSKIVDVAKWPGVWPSQPNEMDYVRDLH
jgi:hypothetical protein